MKIAPRAESSPKLTPGAPAGPSEMDPPPAPALETVSPYTFHHPFQGLEQRLELVLFPQFREPDPRILLFRRDLQPFDPIHSLAKLSSLIQL